jgi:hypothetical protein
MKALREEEDRTNEADVISALGKLGHQVERWPYTTMPSRS